MPPFVRTLLRFAFRAVLSVPGVKFGVSKKVGPFGPFVMDGCFLFSDFSNWDSYKNSGFSIGVNSIRPGAVVLDVGAHVGLFAMPAAIAAGKNGAVVAFEPAPRNVDLLRRHVRLNKLSNVEVVQTLLGDQVRRDVEFHVASRDSGLNSLADTPKLKGSRKIGLPMISLDAFCFDRGLKPNLIKMDIEGGELAALRGARNVLQRDRPLLLLSVHPWHLRQLGHSVEEVQDLLGELGYEVFDSDENRVETLGGHEYLVVPREMEGNWCLTVL
ncbi:MAG: FkbM family methyltransferase [Alphaproteobacteria bacterium]